MLNTQLQNEAEVMPTPQQHSWDAMSKPGATSWSPQQPVLPPPPTKQKHGGGAFRRGSFVVLTLLLLVIFGVGLFAGGQFSRTSATAGSTSTTHATTTVQATSTVETTQEAAIAKVKAAVVEVNVTTQSGSSLGSGVIIDQRGYIVTNNHVV